MTENECNLKDMILRIKQEREDIKVDSDKLKERVEKLKELEDKFSSLSLKEYANSDYALHSLS